MIVLDDFLENIQQLLTSRGYEAPSDPETLILVLNQALTSPKNLPKRKLVCPNCQSEHTAGHTLVYGIEVGIKPVFNVPVQEHRIRCESCSFEWGALPSELVREGALLRFIKEHGYVSLWLDDLRPAPYGWAVAKTVAEAQPYLETGLVFRASLDHDLGDERLNGNGYKLVCWMEETNLWPFTPPTVHSANPVGRKRMQVVIDKHYYR